MEEVKVTYEQAENLKALGFNWECREYYIVSWNERKSQLPSRRKHPKSHKIYMDALTAAPTIRIEPFKNGVGKNSAFDTSEYPSSLWKDGCIMPHFKYATAPTLDQAAKWLRSKGYFIAIEWYSENVWRFGVYENAKPKLFNHKTAATYEEILSIAITDTISTLITDKEK